MFIVRFLKGSFFFVLVAGGLVFVSTLILGKDRVHGIASSVKARLLKTADGWVDEHADLQAELEELSTSYPKRIADVRSTLREAETQAAYIEDERQSRFAIIALCEQDIAELRDVLEDSDHSTLAVETIGFRGKLYSQNDAERLLLKAERTRELYMEHYNQLANELDIVQSHIEALSSELSTLREEQQQFETERQSIEREIERIEHNKQIIELAKRRSKTPAHADASRVSLDQIRNKLERKRTEQEEELRALKVHPEALDYEARLHLSAKP